MFCSLVTSSSNHNCFINIVGKGDISFADEQSVLAKRQGDTIFMINL